MDNQLVVLEGFDGAGKTKASEWLIERYGYTYVKSPEGVFQNARGMFDDLSIATIRERLLFYIAVSLSSSATAKDLIAKGKKVLLDRYLYSTLVYHEILCPNITREYESLLSRLRGPDLVIYIKTDFEISAERLKGRKNYANDELFFHKKRYDRAAELYPYFFRIFPLGRVATIDNNGTSEELRNSLDEVMKG